jgi:hypothetical protein
MLHKNIALQGSITKIKLPGYDLKNTREFITQFSIDYLDKKVRLI